MCRTLAQGGARCARCTTPGSPWAAAERARTRAEGVAADTREEADKEYAAALDALFTAITEATTTEELTRALEGWMDRVGAAWVALCRALERLHERRLAALDARFAERLAGELEAARAARYAEECAALEHLHAAEVVLAAVEFQASAPDWQDPFWHEEQWAAVDVVAMELQGESDRLVVLERRATRAHPDPRVIADLRSTRARVRCWQTTLARQRATLLDLPRTPTEADEAVAAARTDVDDARARVALTDDERAYLTRPELVLAVEHSRHHPAQRRERRGRPVRT